MSVSAELETLKAVLKLPLAKFFLILCQVPSLIFGYLWWNNQTIILNQQKECKDEIQKIYAHFLDKTEKQIEALQSNPKSNLKNEKEH